MVSARQSPSLLRIMQVYQYRGLPVARPDRQCGGSRGTGRARVIEAFLASVSTIGIAEIGDRTQVLALVLAARFRRPWPILAGVFCAALASNVIAALIGERLGHFLTPVRLSVLVGASLIIMALWELRSENVNVKSASGRRGSAFWAAFAGLFIAEIGDKTQIAVAVLAAAYSSVTAVIGGATVGMLLACAPAVFLGRTLSGRVPLKAIHYLASALFLALGVIFLFRAYRLVQHAG